MKRRYPQVKEVIQYDYVKVELIDDNPWQRRDGADTREVLAIAESIVELRETLRDSRGLLHVPIARKVGDRYQLGFGHQRRDAFAELSLDEELFAEMPLRVKDLTDEEMVRLLVHENEKRSDLNPIARAQNWQDYLDVTGSTVTELATTLAEENDDAPSRSVVSNFLRLLKLPELVRDLVAKGELSASAGRTLASLNEYPAECAQIARYLASNPAFGIQQLEKAIASIKVFLAAGNSWAETWPVLSQWQVGDWKELIDATLAPDEATDDGAPEGAVVSDPDAIAFDSASSVGLSSGDANGSLNGTVDGATGEKIPAIPPEDLPPDVRGGSYPNAVPSLISDDERNLRNQILISRRNQGDRVVDIEVEEIPRSEWHELRREHVPFVEGTQVFT
ncbi:MAG: ParB/RepB/Spo0J family partition protein, partial [Cyanobacteria bacterium J06639_1]